MEDRRDRYGCDPTALGWAERGASGENASILGLTKAVVLTANAAVRLDRRGDRGQPALSISTAVFDGRADGASLPGTMAEATSKKPKPAKKEIATAIYRIMSPMEWKRRLGHLAKVYGITPIEVRQRQKDGEACAANSESCRQAEMWGLSERVYETRYRAALSRCRTGNVETELLEAGALSIDSPVLTHYQQCIQDIMYGR